MIKCWLHPDFHFHLDIELNDQWLIVWQITDYNLLKEKEKEFLHLIYQGHTLW